MVQLEECTTTTPGAPPLFNNSSNEPKQVVAADARERSERAQQNINMIEQLYKFVMIATISIDNSLNPNLKEHVQARRWSIRRWSTHDWAM